MKKHTAQTAAALLLIAAVTLYRLCVGFGSHGVWLYNFSPLAAVALCGGIYLPRRLAFAAPIAALLLSDVLLNWHYGAPPVSGEMISRYFAIGAVTGLGFFLRNRASLVTVLPASVLGSLLFYGVTNTSSWLTEPGYSKTAAGWLQALTTGLPGFPETWRFFQSSLISDLIFTALFVLCMAATRAPAAHAVVADPRPKAV